ncbi:MAG: GGDEF domain-containing protein [Spirochaetales bacterium]|nr:GGDEF domain-containing protein [Spirochaetales bacterium]
MSDTQPRVRELEAHLKETERKLKEAEKLNRLHPDTGLPIYRFLLQDLETLIQDDKSTGKMSEGSGCGKKFLQEGNPKAFSVIVIRLDSAYSRIKNTRDRQKALLFKSSFRIKNALDKGCLYQGDRLDEFFVLYPGEHSAHQLNQLMQKIAKDVAGPHDPPVEDIRFGAYVAATMFPTQAKTLDELLTNLEIAAEEAEQIAGGVSFYSEDLGRRQRHRAVVESELNKAIQRGFDQFRLVFQPICGVDGKIRGAEVLVRWDHPSLGIISPGLFVPLAEANGSIRLLGRWIIFQACRILAEWQKTETESIYFSVNLSPVQFLQKDLVESIVNVIRVNKLKPGTLKIEITEGAIMEDAQGAVKKMEQLKKEGIRLSIDDFGTGYSSLAYLKELPLDSLKIDKSFIEDVTRNDNNRAIVRAVISLSKNLGLETLAEGVEFEDQLELLVAEGVDMIQGYYFSPPVDGDTFHGYLETGGTLPLS